MLHRGELRQQGGLVRPLAASPVVVDFVKEEHVNLLLFHEPSDRRKVDHAVLP